MLKKYHKLDLRMLITSEIVEFLFEVYPNSVEISDLEEYVSWQVLQELQKRKDDPPENPALQIPYEMIPSLPMKNEYNKTVKFLKQQGRVSTRKDSTSITLADDSYRIRL